MLAARVSPSHLSMTVGNSEMIPGEEMMLVCKAGKAKPVRLPTLRDVGPIDVRGEVGLTDLFEG
jgi:hypothetical protein